MGQPVFLFCDGSIAEFYGEALHQTLRVHAIFCFYASEGCEKFPEILDKSLLSCQKTIIVFINSPSLQQWHCR